MDANYILEKVEPLLNVKEGEVCVKPIVLNDDEYLFYLYCIDGLLYYFKRLKVNSDEKLKNTLQKKRKYILNIIDKYLSINIKCFNVLSYHTVLSDVEEYFKHNIMKLIVNTNLVDDYSFMPIMEILQKLYDHHAGYDSEEIKLIVQTFLSKQIPLHVLEEIYYNDKIPNKIVKKKLIKLYIKLDENSKVNIIDYINMCENRKLEEVEFILNKTISLLNK